MGEPAETHRGPTPHPETAGWRIGLSGSDIAKTKQQALGAKVWSRPEILSFAQQMGFGVGRRPGAKYGQIFWPNGGEMTERTDQEIIAEFERLVEESEKSPDFKIIAKAVITEMRFYRARQNQPAGGSN
ncbi:hypothetical protein [Mesorhizobium sp. LjNodule214]|uniref:hypothetical protein n=1 Tax=Mesorhizobium sp. LjNodule214 TaxID=3342252 RepID=UPI003ECE3CF7